MPTMRLKQGERSPQDTPASLSWAPNVDMMVILKERYQPNVKMMMIVMHMVRAKQSQHAVQE